VAIGYFLLMQCVSFLQIANRKSSITDSKSVLLDGGSTLMGLWAFREVVLLRQHSWITLALPFRLGLLATQYEILFLA
jgi:hypothetical protein